MEEITVKPMVENILSVTDFVEKVLTEAGCPLPVIMKMNIAVDELFSNIVYYSKADTATVKVEVKDKEIRLEFTDNGLAYDPTQRKTPDTSLQIEEKKIGGLGIFLVQRMMDSVTYGHKDKNNILIITKKY